MMKRIWLAMLFAICLLLSGCAQKPQALPAAVQTATPAPQFEERAADDTLSVRLYFRYQDSAFLAAEERTLSLPRSEASEIAVVQALIAGPGAGSVHLSPLFPPDVRILSAVEKEGTLFLTFNDALLGRYPGENGGTEQSEFTLRRRLLMASLCNTLTECGFCSRVQVLVNRNADAITSLRLPASFFRDTDDETPLGPMYRDESVLLTPYNTAHLLLDSWLRRNNGEIYPLLAAAGRPGQSTAFDRMTLSPTLTSFALSPGVISPDGREAVFCADLMLYIDGQDVFIPAYPLRLTLENGLWRMPYPHLTALFDAVQ